MMNGYNFTMQVREVLGGAREEAAALRHEYVGTEHILLSLLKAEDSVAVHVLSNLGVDLSDVRDLMLGAIKRGTADRTGPDLPYTSRAKKTLELAMTQARKLDMNYVGTEHLLLGLIAEEKGIAAQVLAERGVMLDAAVAETRRVLALAMKASPDTTTPPVVEHFVRRRPGSAGANERLRAVMHSAFEIANAQGSRIVGPAHCAMALLDHGEGAANTTFGRLGLDAARVREILAGMATADSGPITPEDMLQLDQSLLDTMERERAAARAPSLSTAHLALALLDEGCAVAPAFGACGVTQASFREELARISG